MRAIESLARFDTRPPQDTMMLEAVHRSRFVQAVGAIAVGVLDATKPRAMAQSIGLSNPIAFQLAAVRELVCGAAAMASPSSQWPIAVRLAGDVADIVGNVGVIRNRPGHRAAALRMGGAVALLTLLDVAALAAITSAVRPTNRKTIREVLP